MVLHSLDRKQLNTALVDGFDHAGLAAVVMATGRRLGRLVSPTATLDVAVAAVVDSAERGDWVTELIAAAKAANRTNRLIVALPTSMRDEALPFLAPGVTFRRVAGDRIVTLRDGGEMVLINESFWIDVEPVSLAAYHRFVIATGHDVPLGWNAFRRMYRSDGTRPVLYTDLRDARLFATWAGKRLPTAAEMVAVRGVVDGGLTTRYVGDGLLPLASGYVGLRMAV